MTLATATPNPSPAPRDLAKPILVGLSDAEATQRLADARRLHPPTPRYRQWLHELWHELLDPMALMLAVAACVYLALGEVRDGVILLVALIPVIGSDVLLQARAGRALKALATAVAPTARVVRQNREVSVPIGNLVVGDILALREGDVIHADAVLRWSANVLVDEAPLTGESEPQAKQAATSPMVAEEHAVYAGSVVLSGEGLGEIRAVGSDTRYGRAAALVAESQPEPSPLQQRVGRTVRLLGVVAVAVAMGVFVIYRWQGASTQSAFLAAVALALAAIPEEFPLVLVLFLGLGAWRLSRRGILIRRLASIEALGSATVICTDKTGTLTEGHFTLARLVDMSSELPETTLLEVLALACEPEGTDPMDHAIFAYCIHRGVTPHDLHQRWQMRSDYPFEVAGKHLTHVWQAGESWCVVAKGAAEGVLEHCALTPAERTRAESTVRALAQEGTRVLALAGRLGTTPGTGLRRDDETGLHLWALLAFVDPLRPTTVAAVAACRRAGMTLKVLTGDHPGTAAFVARAAGISATTGSEVMTGAELATLPTQAWSAAALTCHVFARLLPEQKHALVEALVEAGQVVAMLGDGVNDTAAMRRASVGICVGKDATPAARAAADIILLDADLRSLLDTIAEGRRIYGKIQRAFLFLLAFHVPIVLLAFVVPVLGLPALLLPVHLVWLEMFIHPTVALVFESEVPGGDVMAEPPRPPRAPLLRLALLGRSVVTGVLLTLGCLWLYQRHLDGGVEHARALGVATLLLGGLYLVWAERAMDEPWHRVPWPTARRFWWVYGLALLSLPMFLMTPTLARALHLSPPTAGEWLTCLAVATAAVAWRALGTRRARSRAAMHYDLAHGVHAGR